MQAEYVCGIPNVCEKNQELSSGLDYKAEWVAPGMRLSQYKHHVACSEVFDILVAEFIALSRTKSLQGWSS